MKYLHKIFLALILIMAAVAMPMGFKIARADTETENKPDSIWSGTPAKTTYSINANVDSINLSGLSVMIKGADGKYEAVSATSDSIKSKIKITFANDGKQPKDKVMHDYGSYNVVVSYDNNTETFKYSIVIVKQYSITMSTEDLKSYLNDTLKGYEYLIPFVYAVMLMAPYALITILSLATVYYLALGVMLAKAQDADKREAAKKRMANAAIGFAIVLGLIMFMIYILIPNIRNVASFFGSVV